MPRLDSLRAAQETDRRKNRLMAILSKGLPTLPTYVLDLNNLLKTVPVDLKKVGKVIRTDPSLAAQVLRVCNSALFGLRRRVINIEEAAILLGIERLRTLVLTCSVMQFASKRLPPAQLTAFWQHSFLTALLSERIARQTDYFEKEQAYLGGLLHDIGQLPLWMLVMEEAAAGRALPPVNWPDHDSVERDYFGMDHCKVGRWIAVSWNFMPSFFDVFEFHHAIDQATHDPYLVGIVAAADQFLETQAEEGPLAALSAADEVPAVDAALPSQLEVPAFLFKCLPRLNESEGAAIMDMLRTEYIHLLPVVIGLTNATMSAADQPDK
jgi:HD-like signal output (HDOD) protein